MYERRGERSAKGLKVIQPTSRSSLTGLSPLRMGATRMGATGQGVSLARVCPADSSSRRTSFASRVAHYRLNLSVKNFKSWNKTAMKTQSNFGIIFITLYVNIFRSMLRSDFE